MRRCRWYGTYLALAACIMLIQTAEVFALTQNDSNPWTATYGGTRQEEPNPEIRDDFDETDSPATPSIATPSLATSSSVTRTEIREELKVSAQTEQPDIVYNEAELVEWLELHSDTGGLVTLGDIVVITQYIPIHAPVEINTGAYGIVFDGSVIAGGDLVHITGEGVAMPVVDVLRAGGENFWEASWNNYLLPHFITATGKDGIGGIAMRIKAADKKAVDIKSLRSQGLIRSYGTNAIGLWLDVPMEAWCYNIEVSGDNSTAVYAPNGAELYYCKLKAEGDGATPAAGKNLLLDTCAASPAPTGVRSINRRILEESFCQLYIPVQQHQSVPDGIYLLNTPTLLLSGGEGFSEKSQVFAVLWDFDVYKAIDTSILEKTYVPGTLYSPFYDLGLFDDVSIELTVEVRDPSLPCISSITRREIDGQKFINLITWEWSCQY